VLSIRCCNLSLLKDLAKFRREQDQPHEMDENGDMDSFFPMEFDGSEFGVLESQQSLSMIPVQNDLAPFGNFQAHPNMSDVPPASFASFSQLSLEHSYNLATIASLDSAMDIAQPASLSWDALPPNDLEFGVQLSVEDGDVGVSFFFRTHIEIGRVPGQPCRDLDAIFNAGRPINKLHRPTRRSLQRSNWGVSNHTPVAWGS
jgi:hypothetical protein